MRFPRFRPQLRRAGAWAVACIVLAAGSGCATQPVTTVPRVVPSALSPVAEIVTPGEAWRCAEAYAAAHPDCEVLVGSGDSMLPLYADRTVLIVRRERMSALQGGMTVVFTGDQGRPVAHTLLEQTPRGWRAMGVGNAEPDRTLVRYENFIGVVVRAFAPVARGGEITQTARAATGAPASTAED